MVAFLRDRDVRVQPCAWSRDPFWELLASGVHQYGYVEMQSQISTDRKVVGTAYPVNTHRAQIRHFAKRRSLPLRPATDLAIAFAIVRDFE